MNVKPISFTFKNKHDTSRWPILVSLDIHDSSSYIFSVNSITGEVLKDCTVHGTYKKVTKHLKHMGSKASIMIILEAGPHGFAPFRYFHNRGYAVKMIAPSSIPHRGKEQKTDRDDAINNLHYHFSGLLRYVTIPDVQDECARECLRTRYQIVCNITKEKQKILSLLKRQAATYELTKSNWTRTHYRWLRSVKLDTYIRQVLDMKLSRLASLEKDRDTLWQTVESYIAKHPTYGKLRNYYILIPGIGPIGATTLILEGRDLNRFPHPNTLMNFTGLIPGKRQSGTKDPAIRITKAGNKYMRTALIGASKFYRDYRLLHSTKKLATLPEELKTFLIRCQNRLSNRYHALKRKGKHSNKVKAAVARELCGFLWEYVTRVIPLLEAQPIAEAA